MKKNRVAIIVPTLGDRGDYLIEALSSIRKAGDVHLVIVAPKEFRSDAIFSEYLIDQFVVDPGKGLVEALNKAIAELPSEIEYLNWLGDDDVLSPNSTQLSTQILDQNTQITFTFGKCKYINERSETIGFNNSGPWATKLIFIGPDLIPQPGALIRRSALESIGRLSNRYTHAFDMDMFVKLLKVGKGQYIDQCLASFRWHTQSLSVKTRKKSVFEASDIRRKNLSFPLKLISFIWEIPISFAVFMMGFLVSYKSQKI